MYEDIIIWYKKFLEEIKDEILSRDLNFYETKSFIKVVIGPRRAGKTYFSLYHALKQYPCERVMYLNFEDNRLVNFDFDLYLLEFQKLFGNPEAIILDEIQNLKDWEKIAYRLHMKKHDVIVTGSNNDLLKKDIKNILGGRTLNIEVFPLTFKEYLRFKGFRLNKTSIYESKAELLNLFDDFLIYGSYPEIALNPGIKEKIAQELFLTTFYRDIIKNVNVTEEVVRFMILKLVENIGSSFSFRSIHKRIKSFYGINLKTLIDLYDLIINSFLGISVTKYSKSVVKREVLKKFYFIDQSVLYINSFEIEKGKFLENLVAVELFKSNKKFYYYKNIYECDFIVVDNNKLKAVQATYELNDSNRERELKGLLKAMKELGITQGLILTYDQEEEIDSDLGKITVLPVWKWLLMKNG